MTLAANYSNMVLAFMTANFPADQITFLRNEYGNDKDFMIYMCDQFEQAEARRLEQDFYPDLNLVETF